MNAQTVEPQTPEQWQEVVNLSRFYLLLDAARSYGLVKGGPDVDAARCVTLLQRGAALGYLPQEDQVDAITRAFAGLGAENDAHG